MHYFNHSTPRGYRFAYDVDGQVVRQVALILDDGRFSGIQNVLVHGDRRLIDLNEELGFAPTPEEAVRQFVAHYNRQFARAQRKLRAIKAVLTAFCDAFDEHGEPREAHRAASIDRT